MPEKAHSTIHISWYWKTFSNSNFVPHFLLLHWQTHTLSASTTIKKQFAFNLIYCSICMMISTPTVNTPKYRRTMLVVSRIRYQPKWHARMFSGIFFSGIGFRLIGCNVSCSSIEQKWENKKMYGKRLYFHCIASW